MADDLTPDQEAAQKRKWNAAGRKTAPKNKLNALGGSAGTVTFSGRTAKRGERITRGKGWRLVVVKGDKRLFVGTSLETIRLGPKRIAVFSVPK